MIVHCLLLHLNALVIGLGEPCPGSTGEQRRGQLALS